MLSAGGQMKACRLYTNLRYQPTQGKQVETHCVLDLQVHVILVMTSLRWGWWPAKVIICAFDTQTHGFVSLVVH